MKIKPKNILTYKKLSIKNTRAVPKCKLKCENNNMILRNHILSVNKNKHFKQK